MTATAAANATEAAALPATGCYCQRYCWRSGPPASVHERKPIL